jgi:hypothetical protein
LYEIGEMGRDEGGRGNFSVRRINLGDAFYKRESLIP